MVVTNIRYRQTLVSEKGDRRHHRFCRHRVDSVRTTRRTVGDAELDEAYLANAIVDARRDDPESATSTWPMRLARRAWRILCGHRQQELALNATDYAVATA